MMNIMVSIFYGIDFFYIAGDFKKKCPFCKFSLFIICCFLKDYSRFSGNFSTINMDMKLLAILDQLTN